MGSKLTTLVFQPPPASHHYTKRNAKKKGQFLQIEGNQGESISAFYIDRKSNLTFLFSHGNAEDLDMIYEWFCEFSKDVHVNLLAYDYDGYGRSRSTTNTQGQGQTGNMIDDHTTPISRSSSSSNSSSTSSSSTSSSSSSTTTTTTTTTPSEEKCYANIELCYKYLTDQLHVPPKHIVVYGRSLGSGPSCYLAEKLATQNIKLGGLILQSPILSIYRVALKFRHTLPGDLFPNVDRIAHVNCPVLVVHGTRDEIVPFWHGQELFLRAPVHLRAKPYWVVGGGHNDLEYYSDFENNDDTHLTEQLREFLLEWVPAYYNSYLSWMAKA